MVNQTGYSIYRVFAFHGQIVDEKYSHLRRKLVKLRFIYYSKVE